jgi:multidrug resistance protein, MATE family
MSRLGGVRVRGGRAVQAGTFEQMPSILYSPCTMKGLRDSSEITLGRMLTLAFPVIISQASETIMLFANRYFVSLLGAQYIPASMSGGLTQFVFTSFFAGIVGYVNALSAQYHGAGRPDRCLQSVSQGLWLTLVFYPLLLALMPLVRLGFGWAGHTPHQVALEFSYYRLLTLGSLLFLVQAVLAGYFIGLGRTRVVMIASVAGIFVNVPLNWLLVPGRWGAPRLGLEGAAIGTLAGTALIVAILAGAYLASPAHGGRRPWDVWKPRGELLAKLLRYGTPAGAESFINVFAFNVFVLLMHSYGPAVATAVTITFNYDLVAFIPLLGVGTAVTAMVGQRMGAGDPRGARRVAYLGLRVALGYAALMVVLFVAGAPALVRVFAGGFTEADRDILPLAVTLLRLAAVYTFADATQVVFAGALRGAGDTAWVMVVSGILHWVMAASAWLLIRVFVLPPLGVWLFFIGFIIVLGLSVFLRHLGGKWQSIRIVESPAAGRGNARPERAG